VHGSAAAVEGRRGGSAGRRRLNRLRRRGMCVVRWFRAGSAAPSVAKAEVVRQGTVSAAELIHGVVQSQPSILVAGTLLFGAGSLLVVTLIVLLMSVDAVVKLAAIRAQQMPALLVRLYFERFSPLVHIPRRHHALHLMLVVLLVFAPALPRLETNGWAPTTLRVLSKVLRVVRFIGNEPPSVRARARGASDGLALAT